MLYQANVFQTTSHGSLTKGLHILAITTATRPCQASGVVVAVAAAIVVAVVAVAAADYTPPFLEIGRAKPCTQPGSHPTVIGHDFAAAPILGVARKCLLNTRSNKTEGTGVMAGWTL